MGTPARLTLREGGTWGQGGERDLGTQTEPTLRPQHVQSVLSPTSVMGDGGGQPRRKGGPNAGNTAVQGQGCLLEDQPVWAVVESSPGTRWVGHEAAQI